MHLYSGEPAGANKNSNCYPISISCSSTSINKDGSSKLSSRRPRAATDIPPRIYPYPMLPPALSLHLWGGPRCPLQWSLPDPWGGHEVVWLTPQHALPIRGQAKILAQLSAAHDPANFGEKMNWRSPPRPGQANFLVAIQRSASTWSTTNFLAWQLQAPIQTAPTFFHGNPTKHTTLHNHPIPALTTSRPAIESCLGYPQDESVVDVLTLAIPTAAPSDPACFDHHFVSSQGSDTTQPINATACGLPI